MLEAILKRYRLRPAAPGDLTVVGDAELQAAVAKLKQQKADALAQIILNLESMGDHPAYRVAKQHLENLKRTLKEN